MDCKNEPVVKSNRLVEASYRLTMAEQRIVLLAIVEGRETKTGLTSDTLVEIRAADYAKTFAVPENLAYMQMIEAEKSLFNRYVILRDINPKTGKEDDLKVRWISAVRYPKGGGSIYIRFSQDMIPYITRLEREFTPYKLEKVANMSSIYAIRIYELMVQWGSIGKREVELECLKKTLMVDKEYIRLDNFKKKVIDIGISQINDFSDLTASYTQRKTGRIVTHLIFTFSQKVPPKQETKQESEAAKPPKQPLLEPDGESPFRLAKAHLPPKTQADYLKLRTAGEIELCIERANEYGGEQEKAGKPVRYGALYRKAIAEGWHEEKARQKAKQAEDAARKEASRQSAAEAKRAKAEKAKRSKMETELSDAWFAALSDDDKNTLETAYVAGANSFEAGSFKRKGYDYIGFRFFIKRKWLEAENM